VVWLLEHFGLTVLTLLSVALVVYLAYVILHPERF
jgi:K+-transporting ATPase KdpF subunit